MTIAATSAIGLWHVEARESPPVERNTGLWHALGEPKPCCVKEPKVVVIAVGLVDCGVPLVLFTSTTHTALG